MKYVSFLLVWLLATSASAQTEIKPWVSDDTVRHFYEIGSTPHQFIIQGETTRGFLVFKHERVQGTVELINDRLFRYIKANGKKEVYLKAPGSRGFGSENPLAERS